MRHASLAAVALVAAIWSTGAAASGATYSVRPGDTLSAVAQSFGTTVAELLRLNPGIDDPDLILVGQRLVVPAAAAEVTQESETEIVTVTGVLTDEGVECQALRGDDGRLYTVAGDLEGFASGDRVRVEGRIAEMSFCMQGTTLTVERIERLQAPDASTTDDR